MIIPIVKDLKGFYQAKYYGTEYTVKSEKELEDLKSNIRDSGYYPYVTTKEELEDLKENKRKLDDLFIELSKSQIQRWLLLAEEKLKDTNVSVYITGGNDDPPDVIKVLKESKALIDAGEKVLNIEFKNEKYEMLSLGYSNPTPWNCPRDIPDKELAEKIWKLTMDVSKMQNCIFNIHVPPYGTPLDLAPKLDENFNVEMSGGQPVMVNVGSKSVREAIEKHQPLLGLHGHIHESRGITKLGSTYCVNPGSEYAEGVLRGVLIEIVKGKVKNHLFTSG